MSLKGSIKSEHEVDYDEVDKATVDDPVEVKAILLKTPEELGQSAIDILNMKTLMSSFTGQNPDDFFSHCRQFVNASTMSSAEILTIDQADTPLWFEMRYGRITASRVCGFLLYFNFLFFNLVFVLDSPSVPLQNEKRESSRLDNGKT